VELEGLVTYGTIRTQDFRGFATGDRQRGRAERGVESRGRKAVEAKVRAEEMRAASSDADDGCNDVITKSSGHQSITERSLYPPPTRSSAIDVSVIRLYLQEL